MGECKVDSAPDSPTPEGRWNSVDISNHATALATGSFHTPQGVGPLSTPSMPCIYDDHLHRFHTPQGVGPLSTSEDASVSCYTNVSIPLRALDLCRPTDAHGAYIRSQDVSIPLRALDLCRLNAGLQKMVEFDGFHTPQGVGPLSTKKHHHAYRHGLFVSIPLRALDLCRLNREVPGQTILLECFHTPQGVGPLSTNRHLMFV